MTIHEHIKYQPRSIEKREKSFFNKLILGLLAIMRDGGYVITSTIYISGLAILIHTEAIMQWNTLFTEIILVLGTLSGWAVNDLADAEMDAKNIHKRTRNPINQGLLTEKQVKALITVCLIGMYITALVFNRGLIWVITFFWAVGAAYSLAPLRLKKRPGLDLLTHGLLIYSFPYYFTLFAMKLPFQTVDMVIILFLTLGSMISQLNQQNLDSESDAEFETNLAILLGSKNTQKMINLLTASIIILAIVSHFKGWLPVFLVPIILIYIPLLIITQSEEYDHQVKISRIVRISGWGYVAILFLVNLTNYY